jgi:hypothetical protein
VLADGRIFETDQRPRRLHDAFPGQTLTRLRELKAVYDPENIFNQNFPIYSGLMTVLESAAARRRPARWRSPLCR